MAMVSLRQSHLSRLQIAGISAAAVIGVTTFPIMFARFMEYSIRLRAAPLRTVLETLTLIGSLASLYAESLGFKPLASVARRVPWQLHIPARILLGALSYVSLHRGVSPPPQALKDMTGKLVLLTGVTHGVGRVVAQQLARQGANLVIVARNRELSQQLAEELRQINDKIQFHVLIADLEELEEVSALDISKQNPIFAKGIDGLVLNAGGVPTTPATFGKCGYETSLTSMHLSHALLTKMCWNLLNKEARVVITSSIAHDACPTIDRVFEAITPDQKDAPLNTSIDWAYRYGRAKFANALFARQLGRLADSSSDGRGILVSSHHPGAVATNLWSKMAIPKWLMSAVNAFFKMTMRSNEEGAVTLIDAVAGVAPLHGQQDAPNGSYYVSSSVWERGFRFNPLLHDVEAAREMWNRTEALLEPFGPKNASWTYAGH
jgi:protochlorophyllide reductase